MKPFYLKITSVCMINIFPHKIKHINTINIITTMQFLLVFVFQASKRIDSVNKIIICTDGKEYFRNEKDKDKEKTKFSDFGHSCKIFNLTLRRKT